MKLELKHSEKYANVGPRLVAALIDSLLLGVVSLGGLYWIVSQPSLSNVVTTFFNTIAFIWLPMSIVSFVYYFWTTAAWGKTIGKAVVGLEVVDAQGKFLSKSQAFMRENVTKAVSVSLLGAGFWAVAFDAKHQAWHDQFAGSYVLKKEVNVLMGLVLLMVLLLLHVYGYYLVFQTASSAPWLGELQMYLPF